MRDTIQQFVTAYLPLLSTLSAESKADVADGLRAMLNVLSADGPTPGAAAIDPREQRITKALVDALTGAVIGLNNGSAHYVTVAELKAFVSELDTAFEEDSPNCDEHCQCNGLNALVRIIPTMVVG